MRKIKAAVVGTGFMGRVHTEAIRRLGNVEVAVVAAENAELAAAFAAQTGVEKMVTDFNQVLADPFIEAVHICTPNALHYPIAKAALEAGKNVICEKPLATSAGEARDLMELAKARNLANCLNHNLRFYPVVQHMRAMIANGALGDVLVVQGTYSQDWLLYDTDFNWRVLSKESGPLRATGDIGSHWMDLITHLTGLPITSLCADLSTFHPTRRRPKVAVETFAGKTLAPEDYDEVPIDTEDYGAVLLKLGARARGAFTVSQVNAGCKNRFQVEIYGTKAGVMWNQERPDELWIGHRNQPNELLIKDPSLLDPKARSCADLPGGHSEGYDDAHKMCFRRFYAKVADPAAPVEYPTFADGYRMMTILEKVIESAGRRAWVDIPAA
jgi:predicted dehydrogenase